MGHARPSPFYVREAEQLHKLSFGVVREPLANLPTCGGDARQGRGGRTRYARKWDVTFSELA